MWYAASYAEFVNHKIHDVTEEERKGESLHIILVLVNINIKSQPYCEDTCPITKSYNSSSSSGRSWSSLSVVPSVLREQEKNWPCYECNRRFVSSEQLQQHLNMHDDKLNSVTR